MTQSRANASPASPSFAPWRAEAIATLVLSWPLILTNLAQTAMTTTDVMMLGWRGPDTLAAGSLGLNLYFAPMIFGLGLMIATSPMLATERGRARHSVRDLRRTVRQGLWIAIGASIPIWMLLWNTETVLVAMGEDKELAHQAGIYVRWLQWAILPFYCYIVLRSFITALERPAWALLIGLLAVVFNALANWCLIFGKLGFPALGIAGSGLATTLSSLVMFLGLALVVVLDRRFRRYRLFGQFWKADWPRFWSLLRLGLPVAGILTFEVTTFNAAALLMGLIDAPSLAAHAIAIQLSSISFMIPLGLAQAATVRVGLAYGARDHEGLARAGWTAYGMSAIFMAIMAAIFFIYPRQLVGAFIDARDPQNSAMIGLAVTFLAFAALFQIVDGAQAVGGGMLRGLHDTKWPMIYAAISYWGIGLPLGVVLAFVLNLRGAGIWIGLCTGLAVVAALLLYRWLKRDDLLMREALRSRASSQA
jgi:MATE family multidrug resistance protein